MKAILGAPSLTGKHARWWSKAYGSGINQMNIIHRSRKKNQHTNCLSHQPVMPAPPDDDVNIEVQIAKISTEPKNFGQNTLSWLKIIAEAAMYAIFDNNHYYVGSTQTETSRAVVPRQLHQTIMEEFHDGRLADHFSVPRLYKTLERSWWWPHNYTDVMEGFCRESHINITGLSLSLIR